MSEQLDIPGIRPGLPAPPRSRTPLQTFDLDDSATMSERTSIHDNVDNATESHTVHGGNILGKSTARHTVGLVLLLCVVFLWTVNNFLASSVLADNTYAKPFFITYMNTSCFVVMMIPATIKGIYTRHKNGTLRSTVKSIFSKQTVRELLGRESILDASIHTEREAFLKPNTNTDVLPTTSASLNAASSVKSIELAEEYLGLLPTARLALMFCLLWFGANYFASACLQDTTVASATILTSTSSVWTLLIGTLTGTEKFTWRKLCGVIASLGGIILISGVDFGSGSTDEHDDERLKPLLHVRAIDEFPDKTVGEMALGDAMALLSALIYGFYTIVLKRTTVKAYPLTLHMPTFFGLVGLINIVLLLPLFPILHFTNIEPFAWPPDLDVWGILAGNSLSSLVADITWAYAMVFTSPLVVTVGLSLTIPLSLVGEMIIQNRYEGWVYWVGAMVVVGSFVFVEREEVKEEKEAETEFARRSMEASLVFGRAGDVEASGSGSGSSSRQAASTGGGGGVHYQEHENAVIGSGKERASDDLEGLVFDGEPDDTLLSSNGTGNGVGGSGSQSSHRV